MISRIQKVFSLTIVLFLIVGTLPVSAITQLADAADQFGIIAPGPNAVVSGVVNTVWKAYDDDQSTISYELALLDSTLCDQKKATIAASTVASSASINHTNSWNTGGPFLDTSRLVDGAYCMEVCVSLLNGTTPYSACDARIVVIRNNNTAPYFTTTPSGTTIANVAGWTYDANAIDAENDSFSFILASAPSFVGLNPNTGLLTVAAGAKPAGTYTIRLLVRDSLGATGEQVFNLIVQAAVVTPPPSTTPTTTTASSTSTSTAPAQLAPEFKFLSPKEGSVFSADSNKVTWEIKNPEQIESIIIKYIDSTGKETRIAEPKLTETEYLWDVTKIAQGSYKLEATVKLKDGKELDFSSVPFIIKNEIDPGEAGSKPLITEVSPNEGAELRERKPLITGEFTAPIGGTIDTKSFKFELDGKDFTEICEVTPAGFKCTPQSDLELGVHKVEVSISDFNKQTGTKRWTFTIISDNSGVTTTTSAGAEGIVIGDTFIPRQSLIWGILLCCAAFMLIAIPWILASIWRRRKQQEESTQEQPGFTDQAIVESSSLPDTSALPNIPTYQPFSDYTVAATPQTPEVNVNYYYPEVTTGTENYSTQPTDAQQQPEVINRPTPEEPPVAVIPDTTNFVEAVPTTTSADTITPPTADSNPFAIPTSSDPLPASTPESQTSVLGSQAGTVSTSDPQNPLPTASDSTGSFGYSSKVDN